MLASQLWSLVAVLAFWCWVAAVGLFIARAFPTGRRFDRNQALVWGGLALVFGVCWAYGLTRA